MEHLLGFADACKANGCIPSRLVIKRSVTELSEEEAKTMNVPTGSKAVLIERVDLADGIPMIYESNLFPYPKYEFLLDESLDGSLYQLLKDSYHIQVKGSRIRTLTGTRFWFACQTFTRHQWRTFILFILRDF